jgi:hypothetical protein
MTETGQTETARQAQADDAGIEERLNAERDRLLARQAAGSRNRFAQAYVREARGEPRPEDTVRPTHEQLEAAVQAALDGRLEAIETELRRLADSLDATGDAQLGARVRQLVLEWQGDRSAIADAAAWGELLSIIEIADGPAFVPEEGGPG